MKRLLISIVILVLLTSITSYAGSDSEKLDNMKESTESPFLDFEPKGETSDKTIEEGITSFERSLDRAWQAVKRTMSKYGRVFAIIISVFSLILFFIFKMVRNKAAQKTALLFIFLPIMSYIIYSYVGPFLSILE